MPTVTYTTLHDNLARYLDEASNGRAPILVTREGGKGNVVIIYEEEFACWQETVHLLSNPVNAARLLASIREADAGDAAEHALVVPPAR